MSKGNLLLGYGRGSVGDIVLSHYAGEQIARARNRNPKNRRTTLQMLQRVIMKTNSLAYSFFYDLANHSFENFSSPTDNQGEFARLNIAKMRGKFAQAFAIGFDGEWSSNEYIARQTNYAFKDQKFCPVNDYIISSGSLPPMKARITGTNASDICCVVPFIQESGEELVISDQTYASVMRGLNINEGDQLTFVLCSVEDEIDLLHPSEEFRQGTFQELDYYRVIFTPGDNKPITEAFIDEGEASGGYGPVNWDNPKNRTVGIRFSFLPKSASLPYGGLAFVSEDQAMNAGTYNSTMACACILSRKVGSAYKRSTEALYIRPDANTMPESIIKMNLLHHILYMGQAIDSYTTNVTSPKYLNQATWMGV